MPNYKVLLLDGIDPAGVEVIQRSKAIDAVVHDKISREDLMKIVEQADGIIVRSSTAVDRELMQKAKRLKVVGRAGVGVDNVDLDAATEHGILVMNSPAAPRPRLRNTRLRCSSPSLAIFLKRTKR